MANAPGKSHREGISLWQASLTFSDEATAREWFIQRRWPDGVRCPHCDSDTISQRSGSRKQPFRCRSCRKEFSIRTGTVLADSNLSLGKWAMAFYLYSTNLKGVSSMKLHRDLGITQKSAWHMAHRLREAWNVESAKMAGPVEVDETYFGGKESNKHAGKKLRAGRGTVGKVAVVGAKDRTTGRVRAQVVASTDTPTLQGFVRETTEPTAQVYTDGERAYEGMPRMHEAVNHSVREWVRGMAHTNGIESVWSMLKRGYMGTYHHWSGKHCGRYVNEFTGRQNQRGLNTSDQLTAMVRGSVGKRLRYSDLIGAPETRQPRLLAGA